MVSLKYAITILVLGVMMIVGCKPDKPLERKWSKERAWDWYSQYDWMIGTNFNPSTSINFRCHNSRFISPHNISL